MAISLVSHAILSLEELKAELWIDEGDPAADNSLNLLINRITERIEAALGRELVTRGELTEYYSPARITAELYLRVLPIISVTTVHESYLRTYDADSLLTEGTDFVAHNEAGKLVRTWSATQDEREWERGLEAVKVVYEAGYANVADIPYPIKDVALRLAARIWKESRHGLHGLQNVNDATGTTTTFPVAMLTKELMRDLAPFTDRSHFPRPRCA